MKDTRFRILDTGYKMPDAKGKKMEFSRNKLYKIECAINNYFLYSIAYILPSIPALTVGELDVKGKKVAGSLQAENGKL